MPFFFKFCQCRLLTILTTHNSAVNGFRVLTLMSNEWYVNELISSEKCIHQYKKKIIHIIYRNSNLDFFDLREELFRSKIGSIDKDEAFALVGLLETFVFLGGGGVVSAKSSGEKE